MFGLLPDLTPRDSHSIWYTSSRNPVTQAALLDAHDQRDNNNHGGPSQQQQQHNSSSRRAGQLLIERSALARLRADEQQMDRRRLHVQNFGSTWLKPPGVPKSLHQIREERREQEEHAEAMRREQLAQELAEAEAAGQDGLEDVVEGEEAGEEGGEVRDLDDEIPDAEESFGFDGGEDSMADELSSSEGGILDDDDEDDDNDEEDEDEADDDDDATAVDEDEDERRDGLVAARMRMADDAFRQAMARGDVDGDDMYGAEEELEASGQGHMLDEEDLLAPGEGGGAGDDLGMDMDADLDDEIPEAGELSGVYEHTDSEAELSLSSSSDARGASSDEEEDEEEEGDISFAPRAAPLRAPLSPTGDRGRGLRGPAGPRSSMDLSGLLSADGSSMMDSSPNVRAQRR
ncbi:hypothetical protein CI238_08804 [Colletotrichum incanum]|uniref:Uncharacterized protein n=1 Tax=Colletotrichum incanum TaxID=1573173 RepID=A0A167E920_COLIC|nr:hypothetical protein CI238_08804 [Colletotrichum incanum]OHW97136.1 replicase polyprotein 1a [Colletotrichum incanum]